MSSLPPSPDSRASAAEYRPAGIGHRVSQERHGISERLSDADRQSALAGLEFRGDHHVVIDPG
jgi:hypothetical protein